MGLSMFKTGLLTGAILLTLEEKSKKNILELFRLLLLFLWLIVLNVFLIISEL
jgi:hypothetical protein